MLTLTYIIIECVYDIDKQHNFTVHPTSSPLCEIKRGDLYLLVTLHNKGLKT